MSTAPASAIRPSLRDNRQPSGSPHTPTSRFISSTYSSPGSTFRQEEDAVILELDRRGIAVGFEGESGPQCFIPFTPDGGRRMGDYRQWLPGHQAGNRKLADAVSDYELWQDSIATLDLGLLEDKLERAVREAYNTYLLTDAGAARMVLVLPSLVPLPVMSTILTLLFERWKYASISLLPMPTMCIAAAGLRSGVVIDIGWEGTTVTPIYEYRELKPSQSTRAMKMLTMQVGDKLRAIAQQQAVSDDQTLSCDLQFVEDTIKRVARCATPQSGEDTTADKLQDFTLAEGQSETTVTLQWPSATSTYPVSFPRSEIDDLVSGSFFENSEQVCPDDEEQPLGRLLYRCLLQLPPDIRGLCISRLTFVGRGASIAGLKERIVSELNREIDAHGWTAVRGAHIDKQRKGLTEVVQNRSTPTDVRFDTVVPPGKDYVEEKLQKERAKDVQVPVQGDARIVDSLGAWAGASLLTSLKVKGVVEIERNKFLDHGLSGASREADISVVPQRMSSLGMGTAKGNDRASWTLGSWG